MSTHYEQAPELAETTELATQRQKSHARRYPRMLVSVLLILANIVLIYLAVDARSELIASQDPIKDSELDPEFVSLAVRAAVTVTVAGIAISYLIARTVEVFIISRLKKRNTLDGCSRTVDITTLIVFGAAAFWNTQVASLANAAPVWVFLAVPPVAAALQSIGSVRSRRRFGIALLVSLTICALTLLAYGRWF